jgi:hypothetical protein
MKIIFQIVLCVLTFSAFAQTASTRKVKKIVFENYTRIGNQGIADTTTINIEVTNDTIWRYTKEGEKQIGDYLRIGESDGKLYYHAQFDKKMMYREYELFNDIDRYEIKEIPEDKKMILGFLCHKVILEKTNYDQELGMNDTTRYNMYVTKVIPLPVHALLNITTKIDGYFPLEVTISESAFAEVKESYKAKYIQ